MRKVAFLIKNYASNSKWLVLVNTSKNTVHVLL